MGALILAAFSVVPAARAQTNQPVLDVTYTIQLDQHYSLYGYLSDQMRVEVDATVNPTNTSTFVTVFLPFSYSNVIGLPANANFTVETTVESATQSVTQFVAEIPGGQSSFDFTVEGALTGLSSLFYKDIAAIPPVSVSMNVAPFAPSSLKILLPLSPSMEVRAVYPSNSSQTITVGQTSYLELNPQAVSASNCQFCPAGVSLVYQSSLSDYLAFLVIAALASVALIASVVVRATRPRLSQALNRLHLRSALARRLAKRPGAKSLLAVLVALCLTMVVLSALFGPPPAPRAYLAATDATSKTFAPYIAQAGWSYLDASQAADGFSRTSQFGTFSAVIIADNPPSLVGSSPFQGGLDYVPFIIIVSSYVSASYLNQVQTLHPGNTLVVSSPSQVVGALARVGGRHNPLGLTISEGLYIRVAAFVGLLSILVPFVALAFLATFAIDLGGKGMSGLMELVGYTVMVYFLAEFAFIVSSVMLGTPVVLHAAISNKETAEGLLGPFGGGTKPRELSGVAGFVFGMVYNRKGRLYLDKYVLAAIAAVIAFAIADPLNVGNDVYDLLLTVTSSVNIGSTGPTYQFLRNLIGQPTAFFQSYLTTGYVASHGAVLFFAAAVPFIAYSRVGKGTGTLLMLFSAVGCGIGFIRIADMVPMETIASIAPGVFLGLLILPVLFVLSRLESAIRYRL